MSISINDINLVTSHNQMNNVIASYIRNATKGFRNKFMTHSMYSYTAIKFKDEMDNLYHIVVECGYISKATGKLKTTRLTDKDNEIIVFIRMNQQAANNKYITDALSEANATEHKEGFIIKPDQAKTFFDKLFEFKEKNIKRA